MAITASVRHTAQRVRRKRTPRGKRRGLSLRSSLAHLTAILKKTAGLCRHLRVILLQLIGLLPLLLEMWHQVRGFFKDQQIPP
jgi:hypothetical protein